MLRLQRASLVNQTTNRPCYNAQRMYSRTNITDYKIDGVIISLVVHVYMIYSPHSVRSNGDFQVSLYLM